MLPPCQQSPRQVEIDTAQLEDDDRFPDEVLEAAERKVAEAGGQRLFDWMDGNSMDRVGSKTCAFS